MARSATDLVVRLVADIAGALIAGLVLSAVRRPGESTVADDAHVPARHPGSAL